jgi:hypothetical protein
LRKFPETTDWGEVKAPQMKLRTDNEDNHVSKNLRNTSIRSSDSEDFRKDKEDCSNNKIEEWQSVTREQS